jgi:hypothetical protein
MPKRIRGFAPSPHDEFAVSRILVAANHVAGYQPHENLRTQKSAGQRNHLSFFPVIAGAQ